MVVTGVKGAVQLVPLVKVSPSKLGWPWTQKLISLGWCLSTVQNQLGQKATLKFTVLSCHLRIWIWIWRHGKRWECIVALAKAVLTAMNTESLFQSLTKLVPKGSSFGNEAVVKVHNSLDFLKAQHRLTGCGKSNTAFTFDGGYSPILGDLMSQEVSCFQLIMHLATKVTKNIRNWNACPELMRTNGSLKLSEHCHFQFVYGVASSMVISMDEVHFGKYHLTRKTDDCVNLRWKSGNEKGLMKNPGCGALDSALS